MVRGLADVLQYLGAFAFFAGTQVVRFLSARLEAGIKENFERLGL